MIGIRSVRLLGVVLVAFPFLATWGAPGLLRNLFDLHPGGLALVSALALLVLSRKWAPLPLLAGTCYMTVAQTIEIGPFTFTVLLGTMFPLVAEALKSATGAAMV